MDIFELMDIGENSEIEFKKAKNSVPKDLWETYSACLLYTSDAADEL